MSYSYKVVFLGESDVGKNDIISLLTTGKFDPKTVTSFDAQFIRKTIELPEGKSISFDIWDTAGQEKYRSLAKIFYKDAKVLSLVFDVTNHKSFDELKNYWYEQIKKICNKDAILAIVANKSELIEQRQVPNDVGIAFAKEI